MKKIEYAVEPFIQKISKDMNDDKFLERLEKFLDEQGKDGWELVKIVPTNYFQTTGAILGGAKIITLQQFLLIFKREINNKKEK